MTNHVLDVSGELFDTLKMTEIIHVSKPNRVREVRDCGKLTEMLYNCC